MRTWMSLAAMAAGSSFCFPSHAGAAVLEAEAQAIPAGSVPCASLLAIQPVRVKADMLETVSGTYRLSNGVRLQLGQLNDRLVADFGRRPRVVLLPTGEGQFTSRDGQVTLRYLDDARGERIVVTYPADARGRYRRTC